MSRRRPRRTRQVGLIECGPVEVVVDFDDRPVCGCCQQRFSPGPEGTAYVTWRESPDDEGSSFPVCPSCAVAAIAEE